MLPLHIQISVYSMSCTGNATNSEKFRKIKTLNILAISFKQILRALSVASLKFFARDGNTVSSENCTTIAGEKNCP